MKKHLLSLIFTLTFIINCFPGNMSKESPTDSTSSSYYNFYSDLAYDPISTEFNMDKILEISEGGDDVMGSGKAFEPFSKGDSSRWSSGGIDHTHQFLCARGIVLLVEDKSLEYGDLIYPYGHVILMGADAPDIDENQCLYVHHFYHAILKKNYAMVGDTAKDKFLLHSQLALELYARDKHEAFDHLGRAIHYLSDMNEPHHASNLTFANSNHGQYEKWVDERRKDFILSNGTMYDDYKSMNFNTALITLAERSAANGYKMKDYAQGKKIETHGAYPLLLNDYDLWYLSARSTMLYAQDAISTFLYIFFKELKANAFIRMA